MTYKRSIFVYVSTKKRYQNFKNNLLNSESYNNAESLPPDEDAEAEKWPMDDLKGYCRNEGY